MYVLYGSKGSGSAAIKVALERCATPYKIVRASTWESDSALAELERLNPLKGTSKNLFFGMKCPIWQHRWGAQQPQCTPS